jgi:hypothetical protein
MQMKSTVKRMATTAASAGLLAIAMPAAGASAATLPASTLPNLQLPASLQMPGINFTPPKVGQISVDIGPTIIGGKVMDPGLHVATPGTALPPITVPPTAWTLPPLK